MHGCGCPGMVKMSSELTFWQGGDNKAELSSAWREKWNKAAQGSLGNSGTCLSSICGI